MSFSVDQFFTIDSESITPVQYNNNNRVVISISLTTSYNVNWTKQASFSDGTREKPYPVSDDEDENMCLLPQSTDQPVIEVSDDDSDDCFEVISPVKQNINEEIIIDDEISPLPQMNTSATSILLLNENSFTPMIQEKAIPQNEESFLTSTLPVSGGQTVEQLSTIEPSIPKLDIDAQMSERSCESVFPKEFNYAPQKGDAGYMMVAHRNCTRAVKLRPPYQRIFPNDCPIRKSNKMLLKAKKIRK